MTEKPTSPLWITPAPSFASAAGPLAQIIAITEATHAGAERAYTALCRIDAIAREGMREMPAHVDAYRTSVLAAWSPTHRLLAQRVSIVERRPDGCTVRFEDGSGDRELIPYSELVPIDAANSPEIEQLIKAAIRVCDADIPMWGDTPPEIVESLTDLDEALDVVRPGWREAERG